MASAPSCDSIPFTAFLFLYVVVLGTSPGRADVYVNRFLAEKNKTVVVKRFYSEAVHGSWIQPLPDNGLRGWLLYASPDPTACEKLDPPVVPMLKRMFYMWKNQSIAWILMAKSDNCSLERKLQKARKAGYAAIIIHNRGSNEPISLVAAGLADVFSTIPAMSMGELDALLLASNYSFASANGQYTVLLTASTGFSWFDRYFTPFFHTLTVISCAITLFILVRRFREFWKNRHKKGIGKKKLSHIPTKVFVAGDNYDVCVICFENFQPEEILRCMKLKIYIQLLIIEVLEIGVLPCSHAFHCSCVDPWLAKRRNSCPVCKRKAWRRNDVKASAESTNESSLAVASKTPASAI